MQRDYRRSHVSLSLLLLAYSLQCDRIHSSLVMRRIVRLIPVRSCGQGDGSSVIHVREGFHTFGSPALPSRTLILRLA